MADSIAFSGIGIAFKRETTAGGGNFVALAEVNSIGGPDKTRETIDTTSLGSMDGYREFIGAFRDGGEVTLELNWTRDSYDTLNTDYENDARWNYQVDFTDSNDPDNTVLDFAALVTNLGQAVAVGDKTTMSVSLKISGKVTPSSG